MASYRPETGLSVDRHEPPFGIQQARAPGEVQHGAVRNARRGRCAPLPAVACGHPRPLLRTAPQGGAGRGGETVPSRTEKRDCAGP